MESSDSRLSPPQQTNWFGPRVLTLVAAVLLLPVIWQTHQVGLMVVGGVALVLVIIAGHSSHRREQVWQDSLATQESSSAEELAQLDAEHKHLLAALDRLPEALVIYDAQERLLLCNQRHRELYPKSAPYMRQGQLLQDILRKTRLNGEAENNSRHPLAMRGSLHDASDVLQPLADGRWVRLRQKQGSDGSLAQLRMEVTTEVRLQEGVQNLKEGVRRSHQMLREIIDALPHGILIYDDQQRLMMCNQPAISLYPALSDMMRPGTKLEDIIREGIRRHLFPQCVGREEEWLQTQLDAYLYAGESRATVSGLRTLADGRHVRVSVQHLSGGGYLGLHEDCSSEPTKEREITIAHEKISRITTTDSLTGIPSRRYFDVNSQAEWTRSLHASLPVSVALIDIDHFKAYNDRYGHVSGDECLRSVARCLNQTLQGVMPSKGFVARYGGEEFVVLLPGVPLNDALALLTCCQQTLAERAIAHDASRITPWLTISVGLACAIPRQGSELSQLLAAADSALNQAKAAGRNRIQPASLQFPNRRMTASA